MLSEFGVKEYELEGLSNYLRTIHGVEIAAAFFEQDNAHTRVSLRAVSGHDVQSIARQFPGGGGHSVAAGCVAPLSLEAAQEAIRDKVATSL
jgi:phosphoesterase RecJ-like protein